MQSDFSMSNHIFIENLNYIETTIINSLHLDIPSEFLEFEITINLLGLCETHPSSISTIVGDFLNFKNQLEELLRLKIIEIYSIKNLEHSQIIRFKDFFGLSINFKTVPVNNLKVEMVNLYKSIQPNYFLKEIKTNIFDGQKTLEVFSSLLTHLNILKGRISLQGEQIKQLSSFSMCNNRQCSDRTYILHLKSISYAFSDTKKTFTSYTDKKNTICTNCRTPLDELFTKRKLKKIKTFLLSDTKSTIKCETESELESLCAPVYALGYLARSVKGNLFFKLISYFLVEEIEKHEKKIVVVLSKQSSIMEDLIEIVSLFMKNFKETCSEEDVLLFVIFNIPKFANKRILLFTSDPVYAFRCAQNIIRNENYEKSIYFDYKSFTVTSGVCIRGYNEEIKKSFSVDLVFNLPISTFLDYKYFPPQEEEIYLEIQLEGTRAYGNTLYSSQLQTQNKSISFMFTDHKAIQFLFLKFREVYKEKIEPERLFDTLFLIYSSIERIMQGLKEEDYVEFILHYFIDKLI